VIIKNFEIKKKLNKSLNYFLLYGPNTALIDETIEKELKPITSQNVYRYEEKEIINKKDDFKETILNGSFFDDDKLIIVERASDKILETIEELIEKKIDNIKIILKSNILEKKSKLRKFFEKSNFAVTIPFYEDSVQTLSLITQDFFKKKSIKISNQIINLIVRKANSSRISLYGELEKIENYIISNKTVDIKKIEKLVNLSSDHDISELINICLTKNKKSTLNILNENTLLREDSTIFTRIFLFNLKRLKNLKIILEKENNIEQALLQYKPPIFWKEKEIIKKQLNLWSLVEIKLLIKEINNLELNLKKNSPLPNHIISNFILEKLENINNAL
jgi:DNA polymerase-3 subunit delta